MNTLTEKERQAIREAAKKYVLSIYRNEYEIERDTKSFIAGAEFLAELRKEEDPSNEVEVEHHHVDQSKLIDFAMHIGDDEQVDKYLSSKKAKIQIIPLKEEAPSEDLVEAIFNIIDANSAWNGRMCLQIVTVSSIRNAAQEIAKLLTPDVNAGLLEALNRIEILNRSVDGITGNESWFLAQDAINKYQHK